MNAANYYKQHRSVITSRKGVKLVCCVNINENGAEVLFEVHCRKSLAIFASYSFEDAVDVFNENVNEITNQN